jgi:HK97 family phage portal protein
VPSAKKDAPTALSTAEYRELRQFLRDVPNFDPTFFMGMFGLKLREDPFSQPYAQHPSIYSANQAMSTAISQTPFAIYREAKAPRRDLAARIAALKAELPQVHPDERERIAVMIHPRERMRAVRRLAPWLRQRALLRAVDDAEVVEDGPWYELFRDVNPAMTRSQLWEATLTNFNTDGTCFWVLQGRAKLAKKDEVPREIWPQAPKGWSAVVNKRTKLIERWERKLDGQAEPDKFELHEIVRFYRYNPYKSDAGLPPLEAVKREIEMDYKAVLFNLAFFDNGAQLGGYLTTEKKMTPEQRKDLLNMLENRHRGPKKAWKPAVFEGGAQFVESKNNHRNMQFMDLRKWVQDTVFMAYRVPKSMVALGDYKTRATAIAETRNFWETNLLPQVVYIEDLLDSDLFTLLRANGQFWGAFDLSQVVALREDLNEQMAVAEQLSKIGWTANDINERLDLGMEEHPWGDIWYRDKSRVPVGEDGLSLEPEPSANDDEELDDNESSKPGKPKKPKKEEESRLALPRPVREMRDESETVDFHTEAYWEVLLARLFTPGEVAIEKKFKRYLFSLRAAQLNLVDQRGEPSSADDVIFELVSWQSELTERMTQPYTVIFEAAAMQAANEVAELRKVASIKLDRNDPEGATIIARLARRVQRTVKTIRKRLYAAIEAVIRAGGDRDAIKAAIRSEFNDIARGGSLLRLARTETGSIVDEARMLVFLRADIKSHEWLTANDEHVRDTHVTYGGVGPVPLGTNFAQYAAQPYTLEFPHDGRAPAGEVINCRCVCVPTS